MNNNKSYFFIALLLLQLKMFGQKEALRPLIYNSAYSVKTKNHVGHTLIRSELKSANDLELPFFDNFSTLALDRNLWLDTLVLVNTKYGYDPVDKGIITFDALDAKNKFYKQADTSVRFHADTLTSKTLSISSFHPSDSLYLSFYYQPGGYGRMPSLKDSLLLQFYAPSQKKWKDVWNVSGVTSNSKVPFKFIMIPVRDTMFFHDGFQFRFMSSDSINKKDIININKTGSIWNLDVVFLDKNRRYSKIDNLLYNLKLDFTKLPFFDDFSYNFADTVIYPDVQNWQDSDVYINSSYCINPISIGVATFDALDKHGKLYQKALTSQHFIADRLTSKSILLGFNLPKDSLYFSFYYQPGGIGEMPEKSDSLLLLFYAPLLNKWDIVWKVPGDSVRPFKRVRISITDTSYFHNNFKFQFCNFASKSNDNSVPGKNGNGDIWNLDYVQLIKGSSFDDTLLTDLAIDKPLYSPLRDFESIPWDHFILPNVYTIATQDGSLKLYVRNNDTVKRNTQRTYICEDLSNHSSFPLLSPSSTTLLPNITDNFIDNLGNPLISDSKNSAIFKITAYIDSTAGEPRQNDTVIYYQVFKNYYAYDDGTAEWSYGLQGEATAGAMLAYKITGFKEDSLQAVAMHFNRSYNNENVKPFYLTVWSCGADGNPDQILYKKNRYFTNEDYYEPDTSTGFNYFHKYFLDTAIVVPDTFFVGWTQMSETFLNVGFDINKNVGYNPSDTSKNRIYYNFQGTSDAWIKSSQSGALMIRPILGNYLLAGVGIENVVLDQPSFYPNPASDWLNIKMPEKLTGSNTIASIFDLTGKLIINKKLSGQSINVSSLKPGMYLIRLQTHTGQVFNSKMIIRPR